MVKVAVIFYSTYGHIYQMAEKIAEGARSAGAEVEIFRIKETLSDEILGKMGALQAREAWEKYPIITPDDLKRFDGIALGGPTRFGLMAAQVKTFIDSLGGLWMTDAMVGKYATLFTSSASQHGGNEMTLITSMVPLFHLGFVVVGLPYSFKGQGLETEITGCSPYGATTIAGGKGTRMPSQNELEGCLFQGKHLVTVMTKTVGK